MVDTDVIYEKLRHIRAALQRIEEKNPSSGEALFSNPDVQDVVLRNAQNALQGCLDIASHIVADEEWGQPLKSADFFRILGEKQVITPKAAETLARLIKFRNILVHEYTRLDLDKTWGAICSAREQVHHFCHTITVWIENQNTSAKN